MPDFNQTFYLTTDLSNIAIGAILEQEIEGYLHPIAYASRKLSKSEQDYSTTWKEALACVYEVNYFKYYLMGRKFVLITDHKPLQYLMTMKKD